MRQARRVPGLYEGDFVGFKIPSGAQLDAALREAVVAVDANVLLNLYRFRAQTSRDLIKVLQSLGDRMVVPHQALREFWRHRQRAAASPQAATSVASEAVGKGAKALTQALQTWAKQVGVHADELSPLVGRVEDFAEGLRHELASVRGHVSPRGVADDPLLEELDKLLDGRVTEALDEAEWEQCVAEGRRRIEAEEPPGYRDAGKEEGESPEGGAGDYLVWYQATRYAQTRDRDLLLVTADEKDDWWWRQQEAFVGPRPELTLEYHRLTGRRLFLLRPTDLLARAGALQVEVDQDSLADAARPPEERSSAQWTLEALQALLARLDREAPVQAAALRTAASSPSGRVSREQVYQLSGYTEDEKTLRGFTRPLTRLTQALQAKGAIPEGVPTILVARYPDGEKTSYFSVPPEIPELWKGLGRAAAPDPDSVIEPLDEAMPSAPEHLGHDIAASGDA